MMTTGAGRRPEPGACRPSRRGATPVEPQSAALRAGSVDDNERWEDYLLYRQDFLRTGIAVHDVDVSGRRIVTVEDQKGHPVLGATVQLLAGQRVIAEAKTHADGRVFLFPPPTDLGGGQQQGPPPRVVVEHGDARAGSAPVTGAE